MVCKEKLQALKEKETELYGDKTNYYYLRLKTGLFSNLDNRFQYPEYSYILSTKGIEQIKLCLKMPMLGFDDLISLEDVVNLYDKIASRAIELCRSYDMIAKYYMSMGLPVPSNKDAIRGGKNDYLYKLALNVIGAAILEFDKSAGISFDRLPEDDIETILISNSFMMFDIYAKTTNLSPASITTRIFASAIGHDYMGTTYRVVSGLDNFIIPPKHTDNDMYTMNLCS